MEADVANVLKMLTLWSLAPIVGLILRGGETWFRVDFVNEIK